MDTIEIEKEMIKKEKETFTPYKLNY